MKEVICPGVNLPSLTNFAATPKMAAVDPKIKKYAKELKEEDQIALMHP